MLVSYFVNGQLAGQFEPSEQLQGRLGRWTNHLRYCSHCGDVWARRTVEGSDFWTNEGGYCVKCFRDDPRLYKVPTILTYTEYSNAGELLSEFPEEVLRFDLINWFRYRELYNRA